MPPISIVNAGVDEAAREADEVLRLAKNSSRTREARWPITRTTMDKRTCTAGPLHT